MRKPLIDVDDFGMEELQQDVDEIRKIVRAFRRRHGGGLSENYSQGKMRNR